MWREYESSEALNKGRYTGQPADNVLHSNPWEPLHPQEPTQNIVPDSRTSNDPTRKSWVWVLTGKNSLALISDPESRTRASQSHLVQGNISPTETQQIQRWNLAVSVTRSPSQFSIYRNTWTTTKNWPIDQELKLIFQVWSETIRNSYLS